MEMWHMEIKSETKKWYNKRVEMCYLRIKIFSSYTDEVERKWMNKQLLPNDQCSDLIAFQLICDSTSFIAQNFFLPIIPSLSLIALWEPFWGPHEPPRLKKIYHVKVASWSW